VTYALIQGGTVHGDLFGVIYGKHLADICALCYNCDGEARR
jgi:hypothetical protein